MNERSIIKELIRFGLVLPLTVSACASPGEQPELVGRYDMVYQHSTERGNRGEICEDGSGQFEILPTMRISGQITNTAGQTVTHGGAKVTGNTAEGDFMMNGQDVGDFSGTYINGQWSGEYTAINGCAGTWTGTRT